MVPLVLFLLVVFFSFGLMTCDNCDNTTMLDLVPELGVNLTPGIDVLDLHERAKALCASMEELGLEPEEATSDEREAAAILTTAYANDPEATSRRVTNGRASALTPASLQNIRTYLDEFGRATVMHAVEVRHLVTNRLLEESQNPDPRIRIRALELLGKISDVGLFSERTEVTITHQTTDELRDRLRKKLEKIVNGHKPIEIEGEVIDVDAELGLNKPKADVPPAEDA